MNNLNIIPIEHARARHRQALELKDALAQMTVSLFAHRTLSEIERALQCGNRVIDLGGQLFDAMEEVEKVLAPQIAPVFLIDDFERNQARLARYCKDLDVLVDRRGRLQEIAERRIGKWMSKFSVPEIEAAMYRAQRVLEGGGTLGRALYLAINPVLENLEHG